MIRFCEVCQWEVNKSEVPKDSDLCKWCIDDRKELINLSYYWFETILHDINPLAAWPGINSQILKGV